MGSPFSDYSGKRFGSWLVLDFHGRTADGKPMWNCLCDCGTKRLSSLGAMQQGRSQSCGCKAHERGAEKFAKTIASRAPRTTVTVKCSFCNVEFTRDKKKAELSMSLHGRCACKSCAA